MVNRILLAWGTRQLLHVEEELQLPEHLSSSQMFGRVMLHLAV